MPSSDADALGGGETPAADQHWIVRLTRRASADVQIAWEHFAETANERTADAWQAGFEEAIADLAFLPRRHAVAEESALFGVSVRKTTYRRRRRRGPAYHLFFRLIENPDDPPMALVFHVRHASARPLTQADAEAIDLEP